METEDTIPGEIIIQNNNNDQKLMRNYYELSNYSKSFKWVIYFNCQITLRGRDYNYLFFFTDSKSNAWRDQLAPRGSQSL